MSEAMLRHAQGLRGGTRTCSSAHPSDAWDVVATWEEDGEGDVRPLDSNARVNHGSNTITWSKETQ